MDNIVELLGFYGGDRTHAMSAWTSTNRELTPEKITRIPALLKQLAEAGHHTPFEKSAIHFLVTVDDATHIQLLKHRIGVSVNGESARYKELKDDKFLIPDDWRKDLDPSPMGGTLTYWSLQLLNHMEESYKIYHECIEELTPILGRKRAKESARFFLPKANQIKLDIMFNFRSFMAFQKLRNEEHAQKEIRDLAERMLQLVRETGEFKHSLEGFGYGN